MAEETYKSEVAKREEEVLDFWNKNDIFNKTVEREPAKGEEFTFYDGPPFATGEPHYGHLVGSAIKDAIPRYWTMKGYRVKRQWGWDCHGLPIENIVEKELGTKTKKDIEEIGVAKFNNLCRERIFTFIDVWEQFIPRFGRWADMKNPYRTMDKDYMESDWWAFKTLYERGLIYEDYRAMHICPRCETTLSQSEVAEGYKDIKDLAVTVEFQLKGEPVKTAMLAWTTTPWTLPGNTALAVGKDIDYVTIEKRDEGAGDAVRFILAKERLEDIFGNDEYEIIDEYKGEKLVGREYEPPFDYFINDTSIKNHENGWKVYAADFITDDSGTGIAHEAPAFGEDDLKLSQKNNLPFVQHVGLDGVFTKEVTDFPSAHVKPRDDVQATDVEVIKYLAHRGLLFAKEKYEHSYPHCWRCDTPLLNYATSSWFVDVTKLKPKLLEYAKDINWSPKHVKEGRWGGWLEGARDWSISRQRFWATTMPVWRCAECKEEKVFGSIDELESASGVRVDDLHKDVVDEVTFKCNCGGEMSRIPDVLDTWFDSGSVPYASLHYPFENEGEFKKRMPVDFIAEGIDQTRTWFYYQHVLAGALFESRAFSNVITNGIVLAEDGRKMSKRLKNYPDPTEVLNKYGADAMRLYILSSPAVAADSLAFAEKGVDEWMKKVIMRLDNVCAMLELTDSAKGESSDSSKNVLDRWIVARTRELVSEVTGAMENYELNTAVRPLLQFTDDLSTWYVRRSRDRLKDMNSEDGDSARSTLRFVLKNTALVMAPFAPFMADSLWLRLRLDSDAESVHLAHWPEVGEVEESVIADMSIARLFVNLALEKRDDAGLKIRQPLSELSISSNISEEYRNLIRDEVNVEKVSVKVDTGIQVWLDIEITPDLKEKGMARDLMRMIQDKRKELDFSITDDAKVTLSAPKEWKKVIENHRENISSSTGSSELSYKEASGISVDIVKL